MPTIRKGVILFTNATVMELVDMTDSKSVAFGRGGSSPPSGTKLEEAAIYSGFFYA